VTVLADLGQEEKVIDELFCALWYGDFIAAKGHFLESLREYERAVEHSPLSFIANFGVAINDLAFECIEEALKGFDHAATLISSEFVPLRAGRAIALWKLGRTGEAVQEALQIQQSGPDARPRFQLDPTAILIFLQAGPTEEAKEFTEGLLKELPARSSLRGGVLVANDRFEEALPYIRTMGTLNKTRLPWDPLFDPYRESPAFEELLEDLNWREVYLRARADIEKMKQEQKSNE
jgi:tetratricopeptide (TPR) repeat protein